MISEIKKISRWLTFPAAATILLGATLPLSANSMVIQTFGSGSAVARIDATGNFEDPASLLDNPYIENSLSFSRVGLTDNNNGCGFTDCLGTFPNFSGNFFYGVGQAGFIKITSNNLFTAIELVLGSGRGLPMFYAWEALLHGSSVGGGAGNTGNGTMGIDVGFTGAMFDTLLITTSSKQISSVHDNFVMGPAIDTVRAQFDTNTTVPEPSPLALLAFGLLGLGILRKRRGQAYH